jgi:hypothetical protein
MRGLALTRSVAVALTLACSPAMLARAQQEGPDSYEQKLKSFDPEAVAAAKAYAQMANIKDAFQQAVPAIAKRLTNEVKSKNPKLNEEQVQEFIDAFLHSALVDNADIIQKYSMLMMLDVYTKEELLALNQFYSSAVGSSILKKMPILIIRRGELIHLVQTYIVPRALQAARNSMKARGVEINI